MQTEDGKIEGELLKKVYFADRSSTITKLFAKLTDTHFLYDTFDKMRVSLAVQILSESVAKGLEHAVQANYFKKEAEKLVAQSTITFVRKMNILFDMMNAKTVNDSNENKRGISSKNIHMLTEISVYISSLSQTEGSTVYWIEGLKLTIKAVIGLFCVIYQENPNFVLLTRFLNQDPLENLFGQVRAHGKTNRNPYMIDFLRIMTRIITSNTLISTNKTNCEADDSSNVKVLDFEVFQIIDEEQNPV